MTVCKRVHCRGIVQGVGFRYTMKTVAAGFAVAGYVRNLPDGRVEVVLEGPDDTVRGVLAELDGPRAPGTVTRVDTRTASVQGVRGFTTA